MISHFFQNKSTSKGTVAFFEFQFEYLLGFTLTQN